MKRTPSSNQVREVRGAGDRCAQRGVRQTRVANVLLMCCKDTCAQKGVRKTRVQSPVYYQDHKHKPDHSRRRNRFSQSLAYVMNKCPHIFQAASVAPDRSAHHGIAIALTDLSRNSGPRNHVQFACQPSSSSSMLGTCRHMGSGRRATPKCDTPAFSAKSSRACQVAFLARFV